MRTVHLAGWPNPVSALGFGCASLGSRISRKAGIAAIERALGAGITWFDVAPSYGDGEAEAILGEALAGANVAILTKVGLRAPSRTPLSAAVRAIARPLVAAVPHIRALLKPARRNAAERAPLDVENIRASLSRSLERLKVDRVAVLALHDPLPEDLQRDDLLRALAEVKRQGLAVRIGIAGSFENFVTAAEFSDIVDLAQFAVPTDGQFSGQIGSLASHHAFAITHSIFAASETVARRAKSKTFGDALEAVEAKTGALDIPSLFLRYALAANPAGVVLASNFTRDHLESNIGAAAAEPNQALVAAVETILRSEGV